MSSGNYIENQMTLGSFIELLESRKADEVWCPGLCEPHSYRGYYEDLAFEGCPEATVGEMLDAARSALGETFTGYKGGECAMEEDTDLWVAEYGCSGVPLCSEPVPSFTVPPAPPQEGQGDEDE